MPGGLYWTHVTTEAPGGFAVRHLVPVEDLRPHRACGWCDCRPVEDPVDEDTWNHNAFDGRERHENGAALH